MRHPTEPLVPVSSDLGDSYVITKSSNFEQYVEGTGTLGSPQTSTLLAAAFVMRVSTPRRPGAQPCVRYNLLEVVSIIFKLLNLRPAVAPNWALSVPILVHRNSTLRNTIQSAEDYWQTHASALSRWNTNEASSWSCCARLPI